MFEVDFHILNQKSTPAIYADDLALRPAAGFAGRIFINTASPYGVYRDTGSAWVQIASNGGGGGGSTGVNGLNGTANIGLGGTLINDTTINSLNQKFRIENSKESFIGTTGSLGTAALTIGNDILNLRSQNSTYLTFTQLEFTTSTIRTIYSSNYGLKLDFINSLFALGDYDIIGGKKNSIQVNDDLDKIFFTTGVSTSNTTPDLFICENSSSVNRFVRLGDVSNITNGLTLELYDSISNQSLQTAFNNVYYGLSIGPSTIDLGDYNQENTFVNFKIEISNNKIYSQFFDSDNITQIISGLSLDFSQLETKFGIFNFSAQPDNYLFINNRDVEFFLQGILN